MKKNNCIELPKVEKQEESLENEVDKYYKRMFNERILGYGKGVRSAS